MFSADFLVVKFYIILLYVNLRSKVDLNKDRIDINIQVFQNNKKCHVNL